MMKSKTIREEFLKFFEQKKHSIVASAPIVIKNDPTLMFTNAGMNQFKDFFLGDKAVVDSRVADTQKCLRVSGKHNDLEEVGHDTYHHTMFEMLGNWSFGDYFKKEAIEWAWELLTEVYKLEKDQLYVSVFGGDKEDGLGKDEEALELWKNLISEDRIIFGSKKDNFWEMGDTGPCGPCSEIHIDLRSKAERAKTNGYDLVNADHPQVVEIWNLVFMEFNRKEDGKLIPLPEKHIDTGMGFERLCMAIQNKESNYETDVFSGMINKIASMSKVSYGKDEKVDIALRVISDHIRAVSFAISDGQLPSNTGAGYVIRRILRRAVRYGFTFLNFKNPFLNQLVDDLSAQFKDVFPELDQQKEFVKKVIEEEEQAFLRTLEKGLQRLESIKKDPEVISTGLISGRQAFELYDTYGFPFDLSRLIASEQGLKVDEEAFHQEMEKQKNRSKKDATKATGDWIVLSETNADLEFKGYDEAETLSRIVRYRKVNQKGKDFFQLVLDKTPFYAESGGQVGDKGLLSSGSEKIEIFDTQKENDLIVHWTKKLPAELSGEWHAKIDLNRRKKIMNNHSATHLLHAALKQVLGKHVEQRGSLVNAEILRFDFSHFSKMSSEEITEVEKIVNSRIRQNIELEEMRAIPIEKAKEMGATALFGEKYGDQVRVITFDPQFSRELCGGTHVPATGNIGYFKILSESSSAAGIRRIEAVTGSGAEKEIQQYFNTMEELKDMLKSKNLISSVQTLLEQKQQMEKEIEKLKSKETSELKEKLLKNVSEVGGKNFIIEKVSVPDGNALKQLSYELRNQVSKLIAILAADVDGKPQISVIISDELAGNEWNAGKMVKELASHIKGGGGGQAFFATAGGKDLSGLDKVISEAKKYTEL